jgi:hypothetical protein
VPIKKKKKKKTYASGMPKILGLHSVSPSLCLNGIGLLADLWLIP